jgi:hypothetical protein
MLLVPYFLTSQLDIGSLNVHKNTKIEFQVRVHIPKYLLVSVSQLTEDKLVLTWSMMAYIFR